MKHNSKPGSGREARSSRNLRHRQVRVHQKILRAIDMRLANFVRNRMPDELLKPALKRPAAQRNMIQNVVNLQRLGRVFADESHCQNDVLVFYR
jgi:hypothetical protein